MYGSKPLFSDHCVDQLPSQRSLLVAEGKPIPLIREMRSGASEGPGDLREHVGLGNVVASLNITKVAMPASLLWFMSETKLATTDQARQCEWQWLLSRVARLGTRCTPKR